MRHIRMLGVCLVAVFAISALAAASASAYSAQEPTYKNCEKAVPFLGKGSGLYTGKYCKEGEESATHEGGYELEAWRPGETQTFKVKGAKIVFDAGAWKVECAKTKGTAETTSNTAGWLRVTFAKCKGKQEPGGTAVKCTSAAGKGKLETAKLHTGVRFSFNWTGWSKEGVEPDILAYYEVGVQGAEFMGAFECGSTRFGEVTGIVANYPGALEPEAVYWGPAKTGKNEEGTHECASGMTATFDSRSGGSIMYTEVNGETVSVALVTTWSFKGKAPVCISMAAG